MIKRNGKLYLTLLLVLVFVDQLTKRFLFTDYLEIVPDLIRINPTVNTGAAFSLFTGNNLVLILISVVVVIILFLYANRIQSDEYPFWTLFAAGLIGNLIDRIISGGVLDFIDFYIWPIFNLADSYLTVSVVIILLMYTNKLINK
ncbi:signal peptidase II [Candidatus Woesearchaeota archaeon]|nr:signal peptidase II [Candidatus Woesearchaeota archaeon]